MAPRSSWKGFLKLSLVSVPVRAFTANEAGGEIHLNQLHDECKSRVKYKKVCPLHGDLTQDQIVSGYEYTKDQYVIVDDDELARLRKESDKAIAIRGFVDPEAIDPIYYAGKNYVLAPDGVAGNKPYALLRQGMVDNAKWAVAQIVMSGREQLVLVRPVDDLLVMTFVNYASKVKALGEFKDLVEQETLAKDEKKLADTLIGASVLDDFDLDAFKDPHVDQLTKLIQLKVEGKEIVQAPDVEEPKIINLMDALKRSVAEAQAAGARKVAPSAKKAAKPMKPMKKMAPSASRAKARRQRKSG